METKKNKKITILNAYCGIGGNRKKWPDDEIEVVAVENNPEIAAIYQDFFPNDKVIVADAHQYILDHYKEFSFIWSSPPCSSHSRVRKITPHQNNPIYPDLKLYEEILFLEGYFKGKWCVENVIAWYEPLENEFLKKPVTYRQHYYWSNFIIDGNKHAYRGHYAGNEALSKLKGFDLSKYTGIDKTKILRNCVEPKAGLHIFNEAFKVQQRTLL